MPWSLAAAAVGAVVSSELAPSPSSSSGSKTAAAAADPFASQRGQYQTQLAAMMSPTGAGGGGAGGGGGSGMTGFMWDGAQTPNAGTAGGVQGAPNSTFSPTDPSYAWRLDQGAKTVNAGAAASGMLNSGNRLMELQNYGQNQASTEYANQFSRLSQLAGANIGSPAAAGQIISGSGAGQSAGASAIGNAVSTGIKGWGNSTSADTTNQTPYNADTGESADTGQTYTNLFAQD